MNTKKIVILSHEYPPYVFGGTSYYVRELAEHLALRGFIVYVVAGRSNQLHVELRNGVRIIRLNFPDVPLRSFWYSLKSKNIISKLTKIADYLIFNAGSAAFLPMWLRKIMKNKRLISIFHGTTFSLLSYFKHVRLSDKMKYMSPLDALYYPSFLAIDIKLNRQELEVSDNIIAVAQHIIEELIQLYPELSKQITSKSHVVYGGIDYEDLSHTYKTYRESVNSRLEKVVYAFIGRLYLAKGVHYTIKAFKLIQEELGKNVELWIFGKGPLEGAMKKYAKRNNLNVRFFGFIPREKLLELLAKYVSVLLFPSLYEGCPYALLEANALGIPVVTWDLSWSKEFIVNGVNGYRATFDSILDLCRASIDVMRLAERGLVIKDLSLKFDKRKTFGKLVELIL